MSNMLKRGGDEVRRYLNSLSQGSGANAQPRPDAIIEDPSLPAIFSPVDAYIIRGELTIFFMTGEYDYDDARLLSVIARYKSIAHPICRTVFLTVAQPGEAVGWLSEPSVAAALVAAPYHASQYDPLSPDKPGIALLSALDKLLELRLARMGEGLAQLDAALAEHLLPAWTLGPAGRDLIRPLTRAINLILRRALNEALPAECQFEAEPLLGERMRVWKRDGQWYRFQSLEFVEDIFKNRRSELKPAYDGIYGVSQDPCCSVDRVHLRVLTAPVDPANPEQVPFTAGSLGGSSLRGDFIAARKSLLEQFGVDAPDLVWAVAECGACRGRSRFREEADPLMVYSVTHTMQRIKQMLAGGQRNDTFRCSQCRQPLGFDHLLLAAYAHFLADQDQDIHFLNEKRPGRRRTFIQTMRGDKIDARPMPVSDDSVESVITRPLTPIALWKKLLSETGMAPVWKQFVPGFIALCMPPWEHFKQSTFIAQFHDGLLRESPCYAPFSLSPSDQAGPAAYPGWLGPLAAKVTSENPHSLHALVEMDFIEELFIRAAKGLGLDIGRAFDGTIEVRGKDLIIPVDLKKAVIEGLHRGHFPGVFAAREAGKQARVLMAAQKTLAAIRGYLGAKYAVRYNPTTREVNIQSPAGLRAGFPLDALVRGWAQDAKKVKHMILAKVGA